MARSGIRTFLEVGPDSRLSCRAWSPRSSKAGRTRAIALNSSAKGKRGGTWPTSPGPWPTWRRSAIRGPTRRLG